MSRPSATKAATLAIALALTALSCAGDPGPTGPQGQPGDAGQTGPPGEVAQGQILRRVYSGQRIPLTKDGKWTVAVPDITLSDMPLVSIYVGSDGQWYEIPAELSKWSFDMEAYITEGGVTFINCGDWNYKIVVVK